MSIAFPDEEEESNVVLAEEVEEDTPVTAPQPLLRKMDGMSEMWQAAGAAEKACREVAQSYVAFIRLANALGAPLNPGLPGTIGNVVIPQQRAIESELEMFRKNKHIEPWPHYQSILVETSGMVHAIDKIFAEDDRYFDRRHARLEQAFKEQSHSLRKELATAIAALEKLDRTEPGDFGLDLKQLEKARWVLAFTHRPVEMIEGRGR